MLIVGTKEAEETNAQVCASFPPHLRALENNLNKPRGGKHVRCLAPAPPRIKPTQHWGFLCESGITRAKGAAAGFAFQPLLKG